MSNEHYEEIASLKANNHIPVQKFRSKRTGLTVIISQVEGPVVNGYFCLATEAHDDDGLPHTLEHLIFLGSEKYPYKGVLDLLANRCLSSGTNAWTDTDHTCYTMTTAGSEGFLNLLPIYLDHVLYPTLTDSGFVTEVHHITGEGTDGGVVYCEMQGRENSGESLTHLAMIRAMYPGHCGYKSETGGIMKNLRESTDNQKVVAYHKAFYRPENLAIIITGQVSAEQVFKAIDGVERRILESAEREPFLRPWEGEVPKLEVTQHLDVLYPVDDEDNGMVYVAWRGPSAVTRLYQMFAAMILMEYLTETSVSPLQARFVEIEDPLASRVSYSFIENSAPTVYLMFDNVPKSKIPDVDAKLQEVLSDLVSGKMTWDTSRMTTVIRRRILEQMSSLENQPHDAIAFMAIGDVLYGHNVDDLNKRLNSVDEYKRMLDEPDSFWIKMLDEMLLKAPRIVTKGIPSKKMEEEMTAEEEQRVKAQKEKLGETGLKEKADILEAAMEKNDLEPPEELLRSVPIPSASSIQFHPVTSFNSKSEVQPEGFDLRKLPVYFQLDQVATNFVYLYAVINTESVPQKLKPYLPLFLELLLESSVVEDGVEVPYEEVVAKLAEDTLAATSSLGVSGGSRFMPGAYAQSAVLFLQVQPEKYKEGVNWIRKLLYNVKFTGDRAKVLATKMENSVAELKRKGSSVTSIVMNSLLFKEESNHHVANMIRQQKFLKQTVKNLDCSPEQILSDLEQVRHYLTKPENLMVHMAADMETLLKAGDPSEPWAKLLPSHLKPQIGSPVAVPESTLTRPGPAHKTVGLGCVESAFLSRSVPAITDFNHEDLPPLMLLIQYLTQLEGPMWRKIRGAGLAYGYFMYPSVAKGQLYLSLFKATHPVKAYQEAKQIAESHISGAEKWDVTLFESAKSSLIFELIEKEKTVGDVVGQSLLSTFKGTDRTYSREFLKRVDAVTLEDLNRVGPKYVSALFDGDKSRTSLVCHPSKVEEVVAGFKGLGVDLEVIDSLDDTDDMEKIETNGN